MEEQEREPEIQALEHIDLEGQKIRDFECIWMNDDV